MSTPLERVRKALDYMGHDDNCGILKCTCGFVEARDAALAALREMEEQEPHYYDVTFSVTLPDRTPDTATHGVTARSPAEAVAKAMGRELVSVTDLGRAHKGPQGGITRETFTTEDGEVLAEFPCLQCGEDTWFGVDDDPNTYVCNSCRETMPAPTPALLRAWAELPEANKTMLRILGKREFGVIADVDVSVEWFLTKWADALERAEEEE